MGVLYIVPTIDSFVFQDTRQMLGKITNEFVVPGKRHEWAKTRLADCGPHNFLQRASCSFDALGENREIETRRHRSSTTAHPALWETHPEFAASSRIFGTQRDAQDV